MRHLANTSHLSKEAYLRKTPKNGKSRSKSLCEKRTSPLVLGVEKGMRRGKYPHRSDPCPVEAGQLRFLSPNREGGRSPSTGEILNAILYLVRGGIQWRCFPTTFPHGYGSLLLWQWRRDGTWEAIQNALRTKVRHKAGRRNSPSAAINDSQTVKTTEMEAPAATTRASE